MKTCADCKGSKPYSDFSKRSAAKDGRQAYCRECSKARSAARYEAKREESLDWQKDYYERNLDMRRQYAVQYMNENQHCGWKSLYVRRCKQYGFTPVIEDFTESDLIVRYGNCCFWCGGEWTDLDHVKAVRDGGHHTIENARPSCAPCNLARGIAADRARREKAKNLLP